MQFPALLLILLLGTTVLSAQPGADTLNRQSAQLEANLKKTLETSSNGAKALLALVDHYHEHGRVFGLVRNARKFATAQPGHPRHKEVMVKLIDGLLITARHKELITAVRQFLTRYAASPEAAGVERRLADTFEVMGRREDAAAAYRSISTRLGGNGINDGIKALRLYQGIENKAAFQASAELAEKLLDQLPADTRASEIGWIGLQAARRYSDWTRSNVIGKKLLARNSPLKADLRYRVHLLMGDNDNSLGQRANALEDFKKALAQSDTAEVRKRIIDSLAAASAKADQLRPQVAGFLKAFPEHDDRWSIAATLAHAYARDGAKDNALTAAEQILAGDPEAGNIRSQFLGWLGDNPSPADLIRAEKILKGAIIKNTGDTWRLRSTLAFELYRDRIKDMAKAKATVRTLLFEHPGNDSGMKESLAWLFTAAADEEEFQADVKRAVEAARRFYHYSLYRDILGTWANEARRDKDWKSRAQFALQQYNAQRDSEFARHWRNGEKDRGQGREDRDWLLKQKLSQQQRQMVLQRQGYAIRHYGKEPDRAQAIPFFHEMATLTQGGHEALKSWMEAAAVYGTPAQVRIAAATVIAKDGRNDHTLWRNLLSGAQRAEDPELARRVLAWIKGSQQKQGIHFDYASEIGARLLAIGLKDEAVAYWRAHAVAGNNHVENLNCIGKLLEQIPQENFTRRQLLIRGMMETLSDHHGAYAAWLADEYFRQGDFAAFEQTLKKARKRQDLRPFSPWGMAELPAQGWLDQCRDSEEISGAEKMIVFRSVSSLRIGRTSSAAALALMAADRNDATNVTEQLLNLSQLTRIGDRSSYAWDRMWPAAQSLTAKKQYFKAAVLLTGMLHNITNVDATRKENARGLIRKAYAGMGNLGFDVDDNSPVAPLLHIGLHLRLGDHQLAVETYRANIGLFDTHRALLPPEIIAFAAETHIDEGGEQAHNRVEDILRSWMIRHSEDPKIEQVNKAKIGFLLAKSYHRSGRYEVARSEYTSVVNRFPKTNAAIESKFGMGETFMAQKIFDRAEQIFDTLAETRIPKIVLRADFLKGVLAGRRGDRDAARKIFRDVLSRMPDIDLADRTLYELAEIYGIEQRFLDQLDLLRTVGRLGRSSKRWHVPGRALSVVVQDTDLGISRGHTQIPIVLRTNPGGDEETAFLTSGGAGKGLFMTEVPTILGATKKGDKVLQVTGADLITVDYPEDFKKEFRFELLANNQIRLGSNADFHMASARILPDDESDFTEELREELNEQELDRRKSAGRPANQVKPGNLIYFRTRDLDRNLGDNADPVPVRLVASSGDQVEVQLTETAAHSGIFEGQIRSGELPAGALASDYSIGQSPLMAIDRDPVSSWVSEPDGATPKWLMVDMKALNTVDNITVRTPNPEKGAPVRLQLKGSHDGRFFYHLADFPAREPDKLPPFAFAAMTRRVWKVDKPEFTSWEQVVDLAAKQKILAQEATQTLTWQRQSPKDADEQTTKRIADEHHAILWSGKLLQPKNAALRIIVTGISVAAMIDGRVVLHPGGEQTAADVFLERGIHEIAIFATTSGVQAVSAQRARENPNSSGVLILPFSSGDFELDSPLGRELEGVKLSKVEPTSTATKGAWSFKIHPAKLRHVKVTIDEYLGESVAVNQVEISGADKRYIPTAADLLSLSRNNVLEIAAGDTITGSYIDEFTDHGIGRNRVLSATLTATYYNGLIKPIAYDFLRAGNGSVNQIRKELLRIDPGERITAEITDFDLDSTGGEDTVAVRIIGPGGVEMKLTATETGPNTGVFKAQIDTTSVATEGKLTLQPGDRVYMRYKDEQNTFPGHAVEREAVVLVRTPTRGEVRIIETRMVPPPEGSSAAPSTIFLPASGNSGNIVRGVAYAAPLTVEVIDPDAAKDSRSSVTVTFSTEAGEPIRVACNISAAFGEADPTLAEVANPALHQGRFVGQVVMRLGGADSPKQIPLTDDIPIGLIGSILPPENAAGEAPAEKEINPNQSLVRVMNLTGKDILSASYTDNDRPEDGTKELSDQARIISDGNITITDKQYEEAADILFLGKRLYLKVEDADRDHSDERNRIPVMITTSNGEQEIVELEETLSHSGIFTASFGLTAQAKPTKGNLASANVKRIESFFDETLRVLYTDETPASSSVPLALSDEILIASGTDGIVAAFSKVFANEQLAIQTQFHIAESYFELFKSHRSLGRESEADEDLKAGRKVLSELAEDYPNPDYTPRIDYLLGNFSQEMKQWGAAIESYKAIVRDFPEHTLAADAQYKLGQCYEKAGQFDNAIESYVTLAASYPKSPLIASVMMRINEHFYRDEEYLVAAGVAEKFLERFDAHEHAPRMAFRAGQCYYKAEVYGDAGETFDMFAKKFPDDDLTAQALFWAGESYRMAGRIPEAFWRYNRCRTDFPESDAAKYSRGRLALPELLAQFEREAAAIENQQE